MGDILLLYDSKCENSYLSDYLQVGGYRVTEISMDEEQLIEKRMFNKDIILVLCEDASCYSDKCHELRLNTEIPIMVISNIDDEWTKVKLFRSGVDDYIAEPFQGMALIARIQARIDQFRRLTRFSGYIKTRDLVIEAFNRRVFVNEIEINLTIKEFDILLYLAQRPNSVVTREELYNAVWSQRGVEGYAEAITTYVMRLRQNIEEDQDNPQYIETIWGVGYRFVL